MNWASGVWIGGSFVAFFAAMATGHPKVGMLAFLSLCAFNFLAILPRPSDYRTIEGYASVRRYTLLDMRWQLFCLSGGFELGGKPRRTYFVKLTEADGRRRDMVVAFTPWLRKRDFIVLEDSGGLV
jgi:hypothetical protein